MRLFQRIGDIVAANLNDLVDRFEDPEVMLKEAIREMDTMIEGATAGTARAIADERLLSKELSDHQQKAVSWRAGAEQGVSRGDDDLARRAIARAHEHEAMAQALLAQQTSAEQRALALRSQVAAMRAKQAEARRKLASLASRRQVARTSRVQHEIAGGCSSRTKGFARFERMHHQIEQAEAEAEALGELYESADVSLEAEIESRERARRIEAELAAIKERLGRQIRQDTAGELNSNPGHD
jgi:phage shock protein A